MNTSSACVTEHVVPPSAAASGTEYERVAETGLPPLGLRARGQRWGALKCATTTPVLGPPCQFPGLPPRLPTWAPGSPKMCRFAPGAQTWAKQGHWVTRSCFHRVGAIVTSRARPFLEKPARALIGWVPQRAEAGGRAPKSWSWEQGL